MEFLLWNVSLAGRYLKAVWIYICFELQWIQCKGNGLIIIPLRSLY